MCLAFIVQVARPPRCRASPLFSRKVPMVGPPRNPASGEQARRNRRRRYERPTEARVFSSCSACSRRSANMVNGVTGVSASGLSLSGKSEIIRSSSPTESRLHDQPEGAAAGGGSAGHYLLLRYQLLASGSVGRTSGSINAPPPSGVTASRLQVMDLDEVEHGDLQD